MNVVDKLSHRYGVVKHVFCRTYTLSLVKNGVYGDKRIARVDSYLFVGAILEHLKLFRYL